LRLIFHHLSVSGIDFSFVSDPGPVAPFIASKLGRTGINVATRIMGLIMAAIGIEFIANGLKQLFPGLS